MDPVAEKALSALTGPLYRYLTKRAKDALLGSEAERALREVRATAVAESATRLRLRLDVPDAEADGATKALASIIDHYVDAGLFLQPDTAQRVRQFRDVMNGLHPVDRAAHRSIQGLDPVAVLHELEAAWLAALVDAARRPDSPLHRPVVVDLLLGEETLVHAPSSRAATLAGRWMELAEQVRPDVMARSGWRDTLESVHAGYRMLDLWGSRWPVHLLEAREDEWEDLEAARGTLRQAPMPGPQEYSPDFHLAGQEIFQWHVDQGTSENRFNGVSYVLDELAVTGDGRARVNCRIGRYWQSMATSEFLEDELMCALSADPDRGLTLDALPRRRHAVEQAGGDPVRSGRGRAAAVSVAAATILPRDGGYELLMPPRSGTVAAHRYFNHVAPSGIFQPLNVGDAASPREYSVEISLLREYAEELHDRREFRQGKHVRTDVEADKWVRWLGRKRAKGEVFVRYTGVSVNLMTLRPEICVLILFRNPGAAREWKLNWEFLKRKHELLLPDGRTPHALIPLDANFEVDPDVARGITPSNTVPNAAAATALGLRVARRLARELAADS